MVSIEKIKQLRQETLVSLAECKKALEQSKGDIEKAKEILRKWGKELANKKSSREAETGIIESYIHQNKKVGVLLDIRCESDFVAKSEDFKQLAREICLQIAAAKPLFIREENIPKEFLEKEKRISIEQFENSGKPQNIIQNIVEGKIKKYKEEILLLEQSWIKDDKKKIKDLITEQIAKLGENIIVKQFTRYEI